MGGRFVFFRHSILATTEYTEVFSVNFCDCFSPHVICFWSKLNEKRSSPSCLVGQVHFGFSLHPG